MMEMVRRYIGGSAKLQILKDQTCKLTVTDRKEIKEKVLPLLYNQLYTDKKVKAFEKHWLNIEDIAEEMKGKTIRGGGVPSIDWLKGFTDGEGSFYFTISKSKDYRGGYQARAIFNIRQYNEEGLLRKINEKYFNGGGRVDSGGLKIESLKGIMEHVIPLYAQDMLKGEMGLMTRKRRDYRLWVKGVRLIERGRHLDREGLEMIRSIRLRMDLNRRGLLFNKGV